jgi:hypothetical protein
MTIRRFIGDDGAVVTGGRVLTGWQYNGQQYYVTGQNQNVSSSFMHKKKKKKKSYKIFFHNNMI